jgi:uridine kinase
MDKVNVADYNFDHPHSLDFEMAYQVLESLLNGKKVALPKYCFVTYKRLTETEEVAPTEIIMFEGFLSLYDAKIRSLMKYKIFIHCDGTFNLTQTIFVSAGDSEGTLPNVEETLRAF